MSSRVKQTEAISLPAGIRAGAGMLTGHTAPMATLGAVLAVLLLTIVALSGWMFYRGHLDLWDGVKRTASNMTVVLDRDISRNLTLYDLSLRAAREGVYSAEISQLSETARNQALFDGSIRARDFGPITVTDPQGAVTASSAAPDFSRLVPVDALDLQDQRSSIGDVLSIRARPGTDGDMQLVLSRRLSTPSGGFDGIVTGSIDVSLFQDLFNRMDVGTGGVVSLFMADGTLLARTSGDHSRSQTIGQRIDVSNILKSEPSGFLTTVSPLDGVSRVYSVRRVGNFPLIVTFGVATADVDGLWRIEAMLAATILLVLVMLSVVLVLVLRREFSRRGLAEKAAGEAAAAYRLLADNVTDIISLTARDGTRTYASPAYTRMLGYDTGEIVGTKSVDFAHPDDMPRVAGALEVCMAGFGQASCVYRTAHRDGRWIWVEARHRALRDENGELVEIVSTVRDISVQKEGAEELARKTGMLDAILANMPDGVCLFDARQKLVAWNVQLWEILDLDRGAVLAAADPTEAFWMTMAERGDYGQLDSAGVAQARIMAMASGQRIESRRRTATGKWVERRGTPMPDGGSLSIYRDVDQEVLRELDLREAYEQVERQATDLAAIAEQAEAAQIEAESARTAADEASRAKSDFLAKMSHEIRTPLNGILGFSDLLLDSPLDGEQSRLVRIVKDAGTNLLAIINDILDVSKIEAGKLQLEDIPLSIVSVADGALSIVRPQMNGKPLTLEIDCDAGVPAWIMGDPTRLRQILLNLLSNAVKFTDRGSVRLSLRYEPLVPGSLPDGSAAEATSSTPAGRGRLTIAVADTGIGIDPARQSQLFQNFHQVDAATTRKYGGTGLGLAICRNLVEAMGGDIAVESIAGQGSTFSFTIEVTPTAPPVEVESTRGPRIAARAGRILVAEDVDMNKLIVERMLQAAGHEVTLVNNGAEALEALRRQTFDMLFMDLEMPVMNGLEAAQAIRASSGSFRSVPIIALTANSMSVEIDRCYRVGMDGHVAKPIDRTVLLDTVDRWLAGGDLGDRQDVAKDAETNATPRDSVKPAEPLTLDAELLSGLEKRIGADQVAKFAHMVRDQIDRILAVLEASGNRETIAAEAHILISVAGNLGLNELAYASRLLMNAARHGQDDAAALAAALPAVAQRARAALDSRYACRQAA